MNSPEAARGILYPVHSESKLALGTMAAALGKVHPPHGT